MQGSHAWRGDSAVFDEDNLVSHAGLVPLLELAEQAGLSRLLDEHVRFTSERVKSGAANATPKLTSIIAGMAAGADSIDDLDVIRVRRDEEAVRRGVRVRHVGDLPAGVHPRPHPATVGGAAPAPGRAGRADTAAGRHHRARFIDIDSLLRPVYGKAKQGASFGHTKIAGQDDPAAGPVAAGGHHQHRPKRRRCWPGCGCGPDAPARPRARRAWSPRRSTPRSKPARSQATSWCAATRPTAAARSSPRSSRPGRRSPSPSPATAPSTPRSRASPTMRTSRCSTPARSKIPTPVT